ncbi:hypothetical protein Tco_0403772 [Tanacetum coccineum]
MIQNTHIILKKWSPDTNLTKEDLTKENVVIGKAKEDNGNYMDDLIDVIRKKVEDLPRKIGICSGRKADYPKRNVVFSPEMKVHDFKFINP